MKRRNLFLLLAATFIFAAISPKTTFASDKTSVPSAYLAGGQSHLPSTPVKDSRAEILQKYLAQFDSPLAEHAKTLVEEADKNNIDWRLLAAIAGVESTYGQAIPPYSYNGWGYNIYGNNVRGFASWEDGIAVVSKAIREEYMNNRGAKNVYEIGATYAASPTWAYRVSNNMAQIEAFQKANTSPEISISL